MATGTVKWFNDSKGFGFETKCDPSHIRNSMELFAKEVMPHFRK